MVIIGKKIRPAEIIPERETDEKACDICGGDATDRTPCDRCKKDLCRRHQIDVLRVQSAKYKQGDELSGIYCKSCLIAEIKKRY